MYPEIPNLDCFADWRDLERWGQQLNACLAATILFRDMLPADCQWPTEERMVLRDVAYYARFKADAMRERSSGDVSQALVYETAAERHYRRLPEWARW